MANMDDKQLVQFLVGRAVTLDNKEGANYEQAAYYYEQAAAAIHRLIAMKVSLPTSWVEKASDYQARASVLRNTYLSARYASALTSEQQEILNNVRQCVNVALEHDEAQLHKEALKHYIDAVELARNAKIVAKSKVLQSSLTKLMVQSLERAESLKLMESNSAIVSAAACSGFKPEAALDLVSSLKVSGSQSYTEEEKKVLALTSIINGREYVPFMTGIDMQEKFSFSIPFSDKTGMLSLSPKQLKLFSKWARLADLSADPKIIENIDCFQIKQTVVSDCSFIASLAVAAQYEKKFKKKLVTKIIFPQNKYGDPVYNSCGKYMIRLLINGVNRKVIIDDFLPIGKHGEPLCSYSSNRDEHWVSLLEKAYLKVMGGYDFPGSNSNIDLHALTGWIPERVALKSKDEGFNKDALFKKLNERFHRGDVLITVATGEMSDEEAERTGLVSAHAYALLDLREVKGKKLIMLKNPWSHVRWRGNYSELDVVHWTEELKNLMNYNPENAAAFDNGVFFIDYDSLCTFFDVVYLNWNPSMFSHTYSIVGSWNAGAGPIKDMYNMGQNPQFDLLIENSKGASAVWILLTRHITDIQDFRDNREYITVLVYKNDSNGTKRIFYPSDPPPYIDGVRINSPHYLCKITQSQPGQQRYTLVISQYEKVSTIFYTLRVFSTNRFHLKKIVNPYKFKQEITGFWKRESAGGCSNHSSYKKNPRYELTLTTATEVLIELKGPKQYQIGLDIVSNVSPIQQDGSTSSTFKKSSGAFRSGFVVLELDNLSQKFNYHIVPSTYYPNQEGPFFLTISSSNKIELIQLQ